jgi:hypothetical protein
VSECRAWLTVGEVSSEKEGRKGRQRSGMIKIRRMKLMEHLCYDLAHPATSIDASRFCQWSLLTRLLDIISENCFCVFSEASDTLHEIFHGHKRRQ